MMMFQIKQWLLLIKLWDCLKPPFPTFAYGSLLRRFLYAQMFSSDVFASLFIVKIIINYYKITAWLSWNILLKVNILFQMNTSVMPSLYWMKFFIFVTLVFIIELQFSFIRFIKNLFCIVILHIAQGDTRKNSFRFVVNSTSTQMMI